MKVTKIYSRLSTKEQELKRMINDLQQGNVMKAERMDRINHLTLEEAIKIGFQERLFRYSA